MTNGAHNYYDFKMLQCCGTCNNMNLDNSNSVGCFGCLVDGYDKSISDYQGFEGVYNTCESWIINDKLKERI